MGVGFQRVASLAASIRFPRHPEQEHPQRDDHRRDHPGEDVQLGVAGADGQIARTHDGRQRHDHDRGKVEIAMTGPVLHSRIFCLFTTRSLEESVSRSVSACGLPLAWCTTWCQEQPLPVKIVQQNCPDYCNYSVDSS